MRTTETMVNQKNTPGETDVSIARPTVAMKRITSKIMDQTILVFRFPLQGKHEMALAFTKRNHFFDQMD